MGLASVAVDDASHFIVFYDSDSRTCCVTEAFAVICVTAVTEYNMSSNIFIALSGMGQAQTQLATSAHNVANLATPEYRRKEVIATEQAGGGVASTVRSASQVGEDLAADLVTQLQSKNAFAANLAAFKAFDKMAGIMLSVKA